MGKSIRDMFYNELAKSYQNGDMNAYETLYEIARKSSPYCFSDRTTVDKDVKRIVSEIMQL